MTTRTFHLDAVLTFIHTAFGIWVLWCLINGLKLTDGGIVLQLHEHAAVGAFAFAFTGIATWVCMSGICAAKILVDHHFAASEDEDA